MKLLQWTIYTLLLISPGGLKAQQNHFIYIQTEHKQPFYVKMDKKLYSSSASGYLIVPKLTAGDYNLAIGFPKSEWVEQQLTCTIKTDAGFLLKNFGEKGWGLFNMQTMNVVLSETPPKLTETVKGENIEVVNNNDAFSTMLSTVVNDSTIRQTETVRRPEPVVISTPPVPDPVTSTTPAVETPAETVALPATPTTVAVPDKTSAKTSVSETENAKVVDVTGDIIAPEKPRMTLEEAKEILKKAEVNKGYVAEPPARGIKAVTSVRGAGNIRRTSIATGNAGTVLIYIDDSAGDTITVLIPAEQIATATGEAQMKLSNSAAPVTDDLSTGETLKNESAKQPGETTAIVTAKEGKNETSPSTDKRFLDITVGSSEKQPAKQNLPATKPISSTDELKIKAEEPTVDVTKIDDVQKSPMINSDCKSFATEDDFLKVRKKMAAAEEDDEMIILAKKIFKSKCFTVEQVKNLSVLFLKDIGKYSFFDMAYPFVADSDNFSTLQRQLSEPYYISRFEAMIRH